MNYQWHYDQLMITRKTRIPEKGKYYERHHILPRSMGGDNSPENLVTLTAREHFLAHWLLWRIHRNNEMARAFWCMSHFKNNKTQGKNRNFSSIGYEESKFAKSSIIVSEETKFLNGSGRRGKNLSDYTRQKIGNSNSGKIRSDEFKTKLSNLLKNRTYEDLMGIEKSAQKRIDMSNSMKGREFSIDHKLNLSKSIKGRILSEDHKYKLSLHFKGKPISHEPGGKKSGKISCKKEYICPHCNFSGNGPSVLRWHFNNCRYK